jgi:iron(III) transport system ATP-binding protein
MTSVRVRGLTAAYGDIDVLENLDLDVPSGSLMAVLGASGSGKTTLLRVLAGFLRPRAGSVFLGDREVAGPKVFVPPEKRRIGIVPQEGALFPHLDVQANIAFGLRKGSQSRDRVTELLDLVGLAGLGAARPQELSGGQQQRVALARALAPEPDVVLLDEPFTALDAGLRNRVRSEVRDVLRAVGTTAVLVTHDQEEALSIADLVAVMRDGRLVQVGSPAEVYGAPADLQVAEFVGDVVELPVLGTSADGRVTCVLGDVLVDVIAAEGVGTNTDVVVLRPEQLVLACPIGPGVTSPGVGVVRSSSYHGHDSMVMVAMSDGSVVPVRVPGGLPPQPGEKVQISVTGRGRRYH